MDIVSFCQKLNKKLDDNISDVSEQLKSGVSKSYEHYREQVGKIRGLEICREEIKSVLEKLNDDND